MRAKIICFSLNKYVMNEQFLSIVECNKGLVDTYAFKEHPRIAVAQLSDLTSKRLDILLCEASTTGQKP